uniref:Uncharacterized protein n=1 Tax=Trichogramma kaykai TaxID=54128 RepID=A0ABD2VXJ2_9HYME
MRIIARVTQSKIHAVNYDITQFKHERGNDLSILVSRLTMREKYKPRTSRDSSSHFSRDLCVDTRYACVALYAESEQGMPRQRHTHTFTQLTRSSSDVYTHLYIVFQRK